MFIYALVLTVYTDLMMTIMFIIVIIIRHQLSLDRPVTVSSNSPSKVFQDVFVQSVYNSALLLASRCCSLLLHVVADLICIFLVPL